MNSGESLFAIEPLPEGGIRYRLPSRGTSRFAGVPAMIMGLLISGLASIWIFAVTGALFSPRNHRSHDLALILGLDCLGVLAFLAGLVPLGKGLMLLIGSTAVELTPTKIRIVEHLLGMTWRRSTALSNIQRFEVREQLIASRRHFAIDDEKSGLPCIRLVLCSGRAIYFARAYSKELLTSLAEQLRADIAVLISLDPPLPDSPVEEVKGVEVAQVRVGLDIQLNPPHVPPMPELTKLHHEQRTDGCTITVPAHGILEKLASRQASWFARLILGLGGSRKVASLWVQSNGNIAAFFWSLLPFVAALWVVAIAFDVVVRLLGQRSTILDVVGTALIVTTKGIAWPKQYEWQSNEIRAIRVESPDTKITDRSTVQLIIEPIKGKVFELLKERSIDEKIWIAAVLRAELQVPAA